MTDIQHHQSKDEMDLYQLSLDFASLYPNSSQLPLPIEGTNIHAIQDGLALYHYNECDENTAEDIKRVRGTVLDVLDGGRVIRRCLPFIPEVVASNFKQNSNTSQFKCYPSFEGTIIYLFYHPREQRWRLGTHKKIDAFESVWGVNDSDLSRSSDFGNLFLQTLTECFSSFNESTNDEVLEYFNELVEDLDTTQTHAFLITNNHNSRIVCFPDQRLYHVCSIDNKTGFILEGNSTMIPSLPLLEFENMNDVVNYVNTSDCFQMQGVFVFFNNQTCLKIISDNYYYLCSLRNNTPSIILRFIELRNDVEQLNHFCGLYNEYSEDFYRVLDTFDKVKKKIINCYEERYIKRKWSELPQEQYQLLQETYAKCLSEKKRVSVSFFSDKLNKVFNYCDAYFLYNIYKKFN